MAKIDPTSLFTEIRGTVGGLTFSKNRGGFFCQRVNRPIPSTRPAPQARRSAFTAAARYWAEHRDDIYEDPNKGDIPVSEFWSDFAAEPGNEKSDVFGGTYKPSGYNWFLTYALLQSMTGAAPMILPPTGATPAQWPTWTVTFRSTSSVNNSGFAALTTSTIQGSRPWITCRLQYNQSDGPIVPPFFFVRNFAYTTAIFPVSFQTELESVFGSIPDNCRAYFSVRFRVPDGRISAAQTFSLLRDETYTYTAP